MLDETMRTAILALKAKGHGSRRIAKDLKVSRGAVQEVIRLGTAEVPPSTREEVAEEFRDLVVELYSTCKGNLVRVFEELGKAGASFSYPTLTRFCREQGIGKPAKEPAGRYTFGEGEEMQHDTSPHDVTIGGRKHRVQTASEVLCFSNMVFLQCYPRFTRFECKLFLTEAAEFFGGVCNRCMIDNTHVVVLHGTGRDMVVAPEMEGFARRLGFHFEAHELGDANRSARVEKSFWFFEINFLAGRTFTDFADLNARAREWCDRVNGEYKRALRTKPVELFAREKTALKPLPLHVPVVYQLHHRVVDMEGYVHVNTNRYSTPLGLIGRRVEVREGKDVVEVFEGPRKLATHKKVMEPCNAYVMQSEHRPPRGHRKEHEPARDVKVLLEVGGAVAQYMAGLKERFPAKATLAARQLRRMLREYPREPLEEALTSARTYGLYDVDRVERMTLRLIGNEFFNLDLELDPDDKEDGDESHR